MKCNKLLGKLGTKTTYWDQSPIPNALDPVQLIMALTKNSVTRWAFPKSFQISYPLVDNPVNIQEIEDCVENEEDSRMKANSIYNFHMIHE